ncbi:MAG: SPOR domain-containing protein [Desulfovibrionaceae bacterium]|nr:SPOR domain-containing protein [Desulfovibrionaceae bacterium]
MFGKKKSRINKTEDFAANPAILSNPQSDLPRQPGGIRIHFSTVLTCGIVVLITVFWSFIFGMYVGRGVQPSEIIPAALMPEQEQAKSKVLAPEELRFMNNLKQRSSDTDLSVSQEQPAALSVVEKKPLPTQKKQTPEEPRYRFTYQAASFKKKSQADALSQRIKALGSSSSVKAEKLSGGKIWYRVYASTQGTENDASSLKKSLASLGLQDARLISRQPRKR